MIFSVCCLVSMKVFSLSCCSVTVEFPPFGVTQSVSLLKLMQVLFKIMQCYTPFEKSENSLTIVLFKGITN